jgi:hypothetical protein
MTKKKIIVKTAPKVSKIYLVINGKKCTIKIRRSSKLCKWLKIPFLVMWNRVYVRDSVVTRRIYQAILSELETQQRTGLLKSLLDMLRF